MLFLQPFSQQESKLGQKAANTGTLAMQLDDMQHWLGWIHWGFTFIHEIFTLEWHAWELSVLLHKFVLYSPLLVLISLTEVWLPRPESKSNSGLLDNPMVHKSPRLPVLQLLQNALPSDRFAPALSSVAVIAQFVAWTVWVFMQPCGQLHSPHCFVQLWPNCY